MFSKKELLGIDLLLMFDIRYIYIQWYAFNIYPTRSGKLGNSIIDSKISPRFVFWVCPYFPPRDVCLNMDFKCIRSHETSRPQSVWPRPPKRLPRSFREMGQDPGDFSGKSGFSVGWNVKCEIAIWGQMYGPPVSPRFVGVSKHQQHLAQVDIWHSPRVMKSTMSRCNDPNRNDAMFGTPWFWASLNGTQIWKGWNKQHIFYR